MNTSLTDRLRGIVGAVPHVAAGAGLRPATMPGDPGGSLDAGGIARAAAMLGGSVVSRAEGSVIIVDRCYGADVSHGRMRVGDIAGTLCEAEESIETVAAGGPVVAGGPMGTGGPEGPPLRRSRSLLFLDLETTGLAGGAGTRAFLVGCARLTDDGLETRQFMLPGDEHERALLAEVAAWVGTDRALVTFNGRSFDLPLIETRFLFHRLRFPLDEVAHLDMLHPSRRLWKLAPAFSPLPDDRRCSLASLEKRLSGLHRIGDVPGHEIPSRYFQFIRGGDARPLEAVLEHNRLDLISTALVMARTLSLVRHGPAAAADPQECLGLGRIYDRAGQVDNAETSYLRAADMADRVGCEPEVHADALRRLAYCRRRTGRQAEAARAWAALAALPRCPALWRREAQVALAIHHEHRSRDLATAHALVLDVLEDPVAGRRREAAEYRLRRLERKLAQVHERNLFSLPLS